MAQPAGGTDPETASFSGSIPPTPRPEAGGASSPSSPIDNEKRPLLNPLTKLKCYSMDSHCKMEEGMEGTHIMTYEVQKLTTVRVFFVLSGTVLGDMILWIETLVGALVYWTVFSLITYHSWDGLGKFVGKESNIRSFISMFTTLVGLLLSFYTSLNINRWWGMRMLGVGGIWQACSKLTLLISSGVTRDQQVLDSIWRYSCASLCFLFMAREGAEDRLENLVSRKLLTKEECQQIGTVPFKQRAEAVWTWLGAMVSQLNSQGLINGPPNYAGLMNTVDAGRRGANVINSYLETPVPMAYVHLLGLMVKLHNMMVAILMGILSAKHFSGADELGTFRTMFRAFFMPFLYNAILLINDDITDPFSGDQSDFPLDKLIDGIRDDARSIVECGDSQNLPHWLVQGKKFQKWTPVEKSMA